MFTKDDGSRHVLVIGGYTLPSTLDMADVYDIELDTWTYRPEWNRAKYERLYRDFYYGYKSP